jgi:hypothetical protein
MTKQYTPKLDANDQEQLARAGAKKTKAALEQAQIPKWEKSPEQIASEIANEFYPVASLFHADLKYRIIKVIEAEREWWERLKG